MADKQHLELDESASRCLDELIAMARAGGHGTSPSLMVSNAVRCWYALATGRATITLSPELAEQAAILDEAHDAVQH